MAYAAIVTTSASAGAPAASNAALAPLAARLPPPDAGADAILEGFLSYASSVGLTLYPHQEEAILALMDDDNVIVHTPTGSGKSLIALAVHFKALAEGRRSFYTFPIKALANEKFFDLCRELGAENVGMMTGDASVNRDAPIICCTAEILANIALRNGAESDVDYVVMDEFHYFSDKERGVAWQVPLLTLPNVRFVLMSATLGDMSVFEKAIAERTGAKVSTVRTAQRPVPLAFEYQEKLLHEAVLGLIEQSRAPVYVVNFTQRAAAEAAQSLLSIDYNTKEEKKRIAQELEGQSFRSPNGKEMQRFLRHGVGLHHAGLLPRYRLLVEKLAQKGLLKVICGTDTLGVGINVPLRTVLFTKLCKFDGDKVRLLPVRDFQQIAGRAGRKGFDDQGYVVALAPEHSVENLRLEAKARAGKQKKFVRKKPPEFGYVNWDKQVFERLVSSEPEPLVSRFEVTHAMLLSVLSRPEGGCRAMKSLVRESFETPPQKRQHKRRALVLLRSLWEAGVIELRSAAEGGGVRVNEELQEDFSLNHALGLYLVDAVERLDKESPSYALDVVSLVEAIVEDPEVILRAQVSRAKDVRMAELKAAGVEYEQRMEELDKVEHPKPNAEFLYESFNAFAQDQPWVARESVRPKSIAREMIENFHSFSGYIKEYGLARSEGVLLRYLSEVYKALVQTVPELSKTEELQDGIAYVGSVVRGADSSLLDEWERLQDPSLVRREPEEQGPDPSLITSNTRAFTALVRNLMWSLLRALQNGDWDVAMDLVEDPTGYRSAADIQRAIEPLFANGQQIQLNQAARSPAHTRITTGDSEWQVEQAILIEDEISEYYVKGRVDLKRSNEEKRPVFLLDFIGAS
jgi:superfamily II RNA helicase